jgi:hypothetical protein
MSGSGNSKFIPLALRLELPSDVEGVANVYDGVTASIYGALWTSMSDPVEGNPLVTAFGDSDLPTNPLAGRYLATLTALYAYDELNTGNFKRLRAFAAGESVGSPEADDGWLATNAALMIYNASATALVGLLSADTTEAILSASSANNLQTAALGYLFNGSNWQRAGVASAGLLSATTSGDQAALAAPPGEWTLTSAPAANTVATATRAAGAAGVRHVLRSIHASINAVAAITAPLTVVVRDGASGVGAILWQDRLTAPAGTDGRISLTGLSIVGSAATAMTVEFTAAPGATNFETLSATGYSSAAQAA